MIDATSEPGIMSNTCGAVAAGGGLLELAAEDDLDGFRQCLETDPSSANASWLWYCRQKGPGKMVLELRTPLMVAATYGSLSVLSHLLALPTAVDVNHACGSDNTTALHCAASGGSTNAVEAIKLLLAGGANVNTEDASGCRPADVISVPPNLPDAKIALRELLGYRAVPTDALRVMTKSPNLDISPTGDDMSPKLIDLPRVAVLERKEYPVDPSLPDIKNSIYATDEFRMYSFKVRPCSRAYSHDWTECPFVHPGENARRRDPRKYHYSCVPCPDFRKGVCRRGDMCEYAHGVFECWLHPAQYRTRLCKDGVSCNRRVCFFAHTNEELRPLYPSTGSAVPSPRSATSAAMEMAAAFGLMPGSPSAGMMPPFTPPMSPSGNGLPHAVPWQQPNVPALHLPGSGSSLQSSRLRTSLNARDLPFDDFSVAQDIDQQLMNDMIQARINMSDRTRTILPSSLDGLYSAEMTSSPRYADQSAVFSPSHKAAIFHQIQQQQQLQASLGVSSPGRMSPRCIDAAAVSSMNSHVAALMQREMQQQRTLRSLSSRDMSPSGAARIAGPGSPLASSWSNMLPPTVTPEWALNGEDGGALRRTSSFEMRPGNAEEPDLSWVHTLVKESPTDKPPASVGLPLMMPGDVCDTNNTQKPDVAGQAAAISAMLEQIQLDKIGGVVT